MAVFSVYTRKVGHGAQASISAVTLISMESNFVEICLEMIRIIRRVDQLEQVDDVERQLAQFATSVNWTEPEKWRDQIDHNSRFLMKKLGRADQSKKFNHCPILSLMNFIYSVEQERKGSRLKFPIIYLDFRLFWKFGSKS